MAKISFTFIIRSSTYYNSIIYFINIILNMLLWRSIVRDQFIGYCFLQFFLKVSYDYDQQLFQPISFYLFHWDLYLCGPTFADILFFFDVFCSNCWLEHVLCSLLANCAHSNHLFHINSCISEPLNNIISIFTFFSHSFALVPGFSAGKYISQNIFL